MGNMVNLRINGNAGADAVLRRTSGGTPVANVRICVNYPNGQGGSEPVWYNLTFWKGLAERAAATIKKGWNVNADANRIRIREWVGQDQQKRQEMEVWVTEFDAYPPQQPGTAATATQGQPTGSLDIGQAIVGLMGKLQQHIEKSAAPSQPAKTPAEQVQEKLANLIQTLGGNATTGASETKTEEQSMMDEIAKLEASIDATQGLSGNPFGSGG